MTDPVAREIEAQPVAATLTKVDGRWVLTMVRELPHPVERVWPKLTEPDQLATWSPVGADRPLTTVGPATSREAPDQPPVDAEVLVSDPPRELVHRWGAHQLRWLLTVVPAGTRLTLEQTFDVETEAPTYGAGWHICLAVLAARLAGHDVERVVGARATEFGWDSLNERYAAMF
jgi:uncharacterized protein YndB with AHSA1/START domain